MTPYFFSQISEHAYAKGDEVLQPLTRADEARHALERRGLPWKEKYRKGLPPMEFSCVEELAISLLKGDYSVLAGMLRSSTPVRTVVECQLLSEVHVQLHFFCFLFI